MVEVTSEWIGNLCSKELLTEPEENEMRIRSFGKIFGGTAALLFFATSRCLPINVQAQESDRVLRSLLALAAFGNLLATEGQKKERDYPARGNE
jgi:hypothetical protein